MEILITKNIYINVEQIVEECFRQEAFETDEIDDVVMDYVMGLDDWDYYALEDSHIQ